MHGMDVCMFSGLADPLVRRAIHVFYSHAVSIQIRQYIFCRLSPKPQGNNAAAGRTAHRHGYRLPLPQVPDGPFFRPITRICSEKKVQSTKTYNHNSTDDLNYTCQKSLNFQCSEPSLWGVQISPHLSSTVIQATFVPISSVQIVFYAYTGIL